MFNNIDKPAQVERFGMLVWTSGILFIGIHCLIAVVAQAAFVQALRFGGTTLLLLGIATVVAATTRALAQPVVAQPPAKHSAKIRRPAWGGAFGLDCMLAGTLILTATTFAAHFPNLICVGGLVLLALIRTLRTHQ